MISYWAKSEFVGQPPSLRYAMASSARLDDLWERGDGVRIAMPFGVPPAAHSIVRIWSADADLGANPGPPSIWPIECVGLRPDADGDSLVDDCDPFPNDGPLADFDGDGVANGEDNCPATPNPDQTDLDERFGGDACGTDDNEGNRARIIFATTTIDDMNAQRAVKGLGPIEWPVVDPVLLPEVVEWCASLNALSGESDPDFAATDELLASIPDVYGLIDTDIATMRALLAEMDALFESMQPDDQSGFAELRRLGAQLDPFMLMFEATDQAC